MRLPTWVQRPRHLLVWFLAITCGLTALLGWFAWRFIELERDLEDQRIQERLETAVDGVASTLGASLSEMEARLDSLVAAPEAQRSGAGALQGETLADDALLVLLDGEALEAHPRSRLLYYPFPAPAQPPPPAETFAAAEALEFRQHDYAQAAAAVRILSNAIDPVVRAGALWRLGRVSRKSGDADLALRAYSDLTRFDAIGLEGLPADLLARYNRCQVLAALGRSAELRAEASSLLADLRAGRWHLTAPVYTFYSQQTAQWHEPPADATAEREALAAAVAAIWRDRDTFGSDASPGTRRQIVRIDETPFVVLSVAGPTATALLVAGPRFVQQRWLSGLEAFAARQGVALTITDTVSTRPTVGAPREAVPRAVRRPVDTGLPWSIRVASADLAAERARLGSRRTLLMIGLGLAVSTLLASAYFIGHSVSREIEVARLQSDFVAAVSHEFRSPLTSMGHLTDLLATGRVAEEPLRRRFYDVLGQEIGRLRRLVEQLLDFRRLDAGAEEFTLESLDAEALAEEVAEAFRDAMTERGYRLELESHGAGLRVRGDRDALARALRNLLENAVAYSPDSKTVWLEVAQEHQRVAIRVRDRGVGIAEHEQQAIFKKFVRGTASRRLSTKGTGLGLAMVSEIVRAHGGEIRLESEPERGSTFTMLLPVEAHA